MNYKSLYRKYRPLTFDDIVEQGYIVRILRNQVISGNIAHAYLFTGTRGTGKTTLARIFAKAINCHHPINGNPCGECPACKALANGSSDLFELDAASNNGVDNVRQLVDSVQYLPMQTKYKVYIIDEVHMFSNSAFNALLKTIEEPPEYCVFILATTEPQKIPDTILSRCIKLDYRLISTQGLVDLLKDLLQKEGVAYTEEAVRAIAESGQGSVRDSLSIAETCMGAMKNTLDYEVVIEVLGANAPTVIAEICRTLLAGDIGATLSSVNYSATLGKNMAVLARDITKYLRDLLIIKSDAKAKDYIALPEESFTVAKEIATQYSYQEILNCLDVLSGTDSAMRYSTNPRFVLETAIAKCVALSGESLAENTARINKLEKSIQEGITVTKYIRTVEYVSSAANPEVGNDQSAPQPALDYTTDASAAPLQAVEDIPFDIQGLTPTMEEQAIAPQSSDEPQDGVEVSKDKQLAEKPQNRAINRAKGINFKAYVIRKTRENDNKLLEAVVKSDEIRFNVYAKKAEIVVQNAFDKQILGAESEYLSRLTTEFFGEGFTLDIIVNNVKSAKNNEDFQNLFDKSKIKINR